MRINRRNVLTLTSAGLASTMAYYGVWSVEAEGLAAAQGPVDSIESFSKAIREAKAGDTIVIVNGRYNGWSADLDCRGTSKRPVTIRPESAGGVVFTGRSHISITGSYVTVDGLRFEACDFERNLLEFKRSDHCLLEFKRLTYVDVASGMLDDAGQPRKEIFKEDNLHMNRGGYEIWRDALRPVLLNAERQFENSPH